MKTLKLTALLICGLASAAHAQLAIDPANSMAWQENTGWTNWAAPVANAVMVDPTYITGYVWCENVGWINLGNGPANGVSYTNLSGTTFGVNIDSATGNLSGYAWGENIGWLNFAGGSLATPAQPARYDTAAGRFYGYVWGENIGWLNLNDDTHYVGVLGGPCSGCVADYNQDGGIDGSDVSAFFMDWENAAGCSDANQDGGIDGADVSAFFAVWEAGGC